MISPGFGALMPSRCRLLLRCLSPGWNSLSQTVDSCRLHAIATWIITGCLHLNIWKTLLNFTSNTPLLTGNFVLVCSTKSQSTGFPSFSCFGPGRSATSISCWVRTNSLYSSSALSWGHPVVFLTCRLTWCHCSPHHPTGFPMPLSLKAKGPYLILQSHHYRVSGYPQTLSAPGCPSSYSFLQPPWSSKEPVCSRPSVLVASSSLLECPFLRCPLPHCLEKISPSSNLCSYLAFSVWLLTTFFPFQPTYHPGHSRHLYLFILS